MKRLFVTLLLTGMIGNILVARPPRPVKATKARVATTGNPVPPARISRIR